MHIPHRTMHVCTCRNDSLTLFAKIVFLSKKMYVVMYCIDVLCVVVIM